MPGAGGAGGEIEADGFRRRGQGREAVAARPGGIMAPVGGVGAVGVLRLGAAGVILRRRGELFEAGRKRQGARGREALARRRVRG